REKVWAMLNDIEALRTLIPGVESLEEVEPNTYKGVAKIGVAGVKGEYTGTVRLSDFNPPVGYRLSGEGRGKPGHVKGEGSIELTSDTPDQTVLHYSGDVQVGGMIANVGQRLIEGAAKMLIGQGMKALAQRVEKQG
ncbi:MAG TPA: carbon monoxide dehydrogenase subunit G, partial [Herpetosiphonaceae bacterium]